MFFNYSMPRRAAQGGACELNVEHGVALLQKEFGEHPEITTDELEILGAVYDVETGAVRWL